jgi:hypothetical protein
MAGLTTVHVVGGAYTDQSMLDTTAEELRQFMRDNFESNFCKSKTPSTPYSRRLFVNG